MCLIVFGWKVHKEYPLILAANRDEFYERPTTTAHWWEDQPEIFGGRDLKAGGSWMAINKKGKFAAVTNYRQFPITKSYDTTRGDLVLNFVNGEDSPERYFEWLQKYGENFEGFNLLFGNKEQLFYFGNRANKNGEVEAGVHGLSNHVLNTPWPKVEKAKEAFSKKLKEGKVNPNEFIDVLQNKELAPHSDLPDTGIGLEKEKQLSAMFIQMDGYGTRASYATLISNSGKVDFVEKSHLPEATTKESFETTGST